MEKIKKKVLILGATGMLGHQVLEYFLKDDKYETIDISFRKKYRENTIILDLTNKKEVASVVLNLQPDYIINCVGVLISGSQTNISNAIYINAYLPHQLSSLCDIMNSKFIHISTDCVFSGEKGEYSETDIKDGKDVYSKTKALGEVINNSHLTLRTSIIGPELKKNGEGLFHWFLSQEGEISGYTKAVWSGVTTLELAKIIKIAIEQKLTGLYHVTNGNAINKYELLKLFGLYTNKQLTINPVEGKSVNKSLIDTRKELDHIIPDYEEMIKDMVDDFKNNTERYHHS